MQEAGFSQALAGSVWTFGEVEFDEVRWSLRVAGAPVALEPKPLRILSMLLRRAGQVVTRDDLLAELWPGTPVVDKAVTNAVGKLRQALGQDGVSCIATVPKLGYRLTAEVQRLQLGAQASAPSAALAPPAEQAPEEAAAAAPEPAMAMPAQVPEDLPGDVDWHHAWRPGERGWRASAGMALMLLALGLCGVLAWEARQAQLTVASAQAERRQAHSLQLRLLDALAETGRVDDAQREVEALRARLSEGDPELSAQAAQLHQRLRQSLRSPQATALPPASGGEVLQAAR